MRNLRKNQRDMWYALYNKKIPILDENGDETGDYKMGYGPPVFFQASLSAGKGSVRANVFGGRCRLYTNHIYYRYRFADYRNFSYMV